MSDILNEITFATAKKQIGDTGWEELQNLCTYLSLPEDAFATIKPRYASSPIVRSESEFLSLSSPRFAIRFYFDESRHTFINCRRLNLMLETLGTAPQPRRAPDHSRNSLIYSSDGIIDYQSVFNVAIADGLLPPPPCLHAHFQSLVINDSTFHIIKAKLGKVYGETIPTNKAGHNGQDVDVLKEPDFFGTPYTKTVEFTGGVCAQASCYIANSLLSEYATGLFGLGEITSMIQGDRYEELAVGGITEEEVCRYFHQVGLRAIFQISQPTRECLKVDENYKRALRAYIKSNMPVILIVDSKRMAVDDDNNKSIYKANGWEDQSAKPIASQKHAIVLIGCGMEENNDIVLFHDCSQMPYMAATFENQMNEVGYFSEDHEGLHRCPVALPVTPHAVVVPLLPYLAPGLTYERFENGLLLFSKFIDKYTSAYSGFEDFKTYCPWPGEFYLIQIKTLPYLPTCLIEILLNASEPVLKDERQADFEIKLKDVLLDLVNKLAWLPTHWVWVEVRPSAIRIWNAEIPLPTDEELRHSPNLLDLRLADYIPATIKITDASPKHYLHSQQQYPKKLQIGLISSFTVHGMRDAAEHWPISPSPCVELYTFMLDDLQYLFENNIGHNNNIIESTSVVSALDKAWVKYSSLDIDQKKTFIDEIHNRITNTFKEQVIRAFASYIPEILADPNMAEVSAQNALSFIVTLAQTFAQPHKPFTVEIVAGSLIQSIWRARMRDEVHGLGALLLNRRMSMNLLLSRLAPVAALAANNKDKPVQIAIELEPGPLYNLNEASGLHDLCNMLEHSSDPNIRKVVGVNLDIAHWDFLAKINHHWLDLPENRCVRDRIIHAHVSDHFNGHLDNYIGAFHWNVFKDWLSLVSKIASEHRQNSPVFSGVISLELEAIKCPDLLDISLGRLDMLMKMIFAL